MENKFQYNRAECITQWVFDNFKLNKITIKYFNKLLFIISTMKDNNSSLNNIQRTIDLDPHIDYNIDGKELAKTFKIQH